MAIKLGSPQESVSGIKPDLRRGYVDPASGRSTRRRGGTIDEEVIMRFHGTLELNGRTATGVEVPGEVVERLGQGRRPAVKVTINGHAYRSTVASMGGRFMLPVSAENREAAGIAAGDSVEVDVELDTEPREVTVPDDLAEALAANADAKRFFDGLSYSKQRWFVESVTGAKKPETRARRVEQAVTMLREKRSR
jgi:bifunctional DNA-binding transcriptional regulator/antitoxin component of YhaV-PrlF toxin-antitoxin module